MIYTDLTKKALKISFEAHKNQTDKSGMPYVYHPFHLAEQMRDECSTCVALLHDVVEDSCFTLNDLVAAGFPDAITEAVGLMTHDKSVPYMDYVAAIKNNPIAWKVKIADLRHNSDLSRLDIIDDKALERVKKYKKAIQLLNTIEKLEITSGIGSVLRNIFLTKESITFNYITKPNMKVFEFPEDFFEKRTINITQEEYFRITDRIFELGLTDIEEHVNPFIPPGAMPHHLGYELFDGTIHYWRDYITPPEPFNKIALLLDCFCEQKKILTDEEIAEILRPKTIDRTPKTIVGLTLPCCNIKVPKSYRYCPQCGREINDCEECEFEYDIEKTISLCEECGGILPYDDKYCGSCGHKSRFWD